MILLSISDLYTEADDYSSNLHQDGAARPKVLVLSRVVVGKALKKKNNQTDRTGVESPYHSVSKLVKPTCLPCDDRLVITAYWQAWRSSQLPGMCSLYSIHPIHLDLLLLA